MDKIEKKRKHNQVFVMSLRWFFSIPNQPLLSYPDMEAVNMMKSWLASQAKKWIFQVETSLTGLRHIQGYLDLKTKARPKSLAKRINGQFRGIELSRSSTKGQEALKSYCMKEATRISGPYADRKIYRGQDLKPMFAWQKQLYEMITPQCDDDRHVNLIVDPPGELGKSHLAKHLAYFKKVPVFGYMKSSDILHAVAKMGPRDGYVFNLSKMKPQDIAASEIWSAIEQLKDGNFIDGKYQSEMVLMESPHLWVFANHCPDFNFLTKNRWHVWTVENDVLLHKYTR